MRSIKDNMALSNIQYNDYHYVTIMKTAVNSIIIFKTDFINAIKHNI